MIYGEQMEVQVWKSTERQRQKGSSPAPGGSARAAFGPPGRLVRANPRACRRLSSLSTRILACKGRSCQPAVDVAPPDGPPHLVCSTSGWTELGWTGLGGLGWARGELQLAKPFGSSRRTPRSLVGADFSITHGSVTIARTVMERNSPQQHCKRASIYMSSLRAHCCPASPLALRGRPARVLPTSFPQAASPRRASSGAEICSAAGAPARPGTFARAHWPPERAQEVVIFPLGCDKSSVSRVTPTRIITCR